MWGVKKFLLYSVGGVILLVAGCLFIVGGIGVILAEPDGEDFLSYAVTAGYSCSLLLGGASLLLMSIVLFRYVWINMAEILQDFVRRVCGPPVKNALILCGLDDALAENVQAFCDSADLSQNAESRLVQAYVMGYATPEDVRVLLDNPKVVDVTKDLLGLSQQMGALGIPWDVLLWHLGIVKSDDDIHTGSAKIAESLKERLPKLYGADPGVTVTLEEGDDEETYTVAAAVEWRCHDRLHTVSISIYPKTEHDLTDYDARDSLEAALARAILDAVSKSTPYHTARRDEAC